MKKNTNSQPFWWSLITLMVVLVLSIAFPSSMIKLKHISFDSFQKIQPRVYQSSNVRIIDIDDASLAKIGQWPWSRNQLTLMLEKLITMGASVIVFDMVFAEKDRTSPVEMIKNMQASDELKKLLRQLPDPDKKFTEMIKKGVVITGFPLSKNTQETNNPVNKTSFIVMGENPFVLMNSFPGVIVNLPEFSSVAVGNGTFSFASDEDGVVRRIPLVMKSAEHIFPSLLAETLRVLQKTQNIIIKSLDDGFAGIAEINIGKISIDTNAMGEIWSYYTLPAKQRYISAAKVINGTVSESQIKNNIVLVGTSAKGLQDLRYNPLGYNFPGVEAHAQAFEQVMQKSYLVHPEWSIVATIVLLIFVWILLLVLQRRLNSIQLLLFSVVVLLLIVFSSWKLFEIEHLLIDPLLPSFAILLLYFSLVIPKEWQSEKEKKWINDAFSRYVSPNRVKYLIANPESLKLGGECRECSFVMTDLAGFTSLMEAIEPEESVAVLNEYLDEMIKIIFKHQGTLDRIVGDAVAAIFSAPIQQVDHAQRAVDCAIEMELFASQFAREKQQQNMPFGETRIGVNTGQVLVGNFGGQLMSDYRALGDAINTASRLESVNKQLGTRICVAHATVEQCSNFCGRAIGTLFLKGKKEGVVAYEILTEEQRKSVAVEAYLKLFPMLQENTSNIINEWQQLAKMYPDDALIKYHCERLMSGESGTDIILSKK
ncbi:MAG: adenylate/guanylate cyclase domain-containing protein [Methylococcales bacterium]|jgi:adenylate cyclase|nr:adenylate/guanylate cyclase domain-containing protein [Methylococcales bacterium]